MLSDSEDEIPDVDPQFTINEHYAKAFQYRKEREELEKLKAKLGSDVSESDIEEEETDSESAESEDEDGEELTPAVDAAILRTLARIRRKDPSIYISGKDVFGEEREKIPIGPVKNRKKEKDLSQPVTLRQIALEAQLNPSRSPSPEPLTHVDEQRTLRNEAISAFHTAVSDTKGDAEGEDDLLVLREKTKEEQEQEQEEYRSFLEREVGDLKEIVSSLDVGEVPRDTDEANPKGEHKRKGAKMIKDGKQSSASAKAERKSKEQENQEFLMNYVLNRGWIDKSKNHVPTYKEVTSKPRSGKGKHETTANASSDHETDPQQPTNDLEEENAALSDSSFDSLADQFESSYNFRFEEPDGTAIPSFPRQIPSLVRREDGKRKDARERRKKRKEEEVQKKREEVRRMKALKMREIRRKLEFIGKEGGVLGSGKRWDEDEGGEMDAALQALDLEGDWDPEKHDQQMAGLFAHGEDGEGDWDDAGQVDEDGKPVWEDDIDIGGISIQVDNDDDFPIGSNSKKDKQKKKKKKKGKEEDPEEDGVDMDVMDADVQALRREMGEEEEEEWDGTEEMRKRKLDEYMEEVYNLDFNDMVGDLPTRFKYTSAAPQSYSIAPVEILMATDKELNEFMSVKKYAPYRNEARKWDVQRQQRLKEFRTAISKRAEAGGWQIRGGIVSTEEGGEGRGGERVKKRKGKKERLKAKAAVTTDTQAEGQGEEVLAPNGDNLDAVSKGENEEKGQGHKRRHDETTEVGEDAQQEERSKPKKKRRRRHKNNTEGRIAQVE